MKEYIKKNRVRICMVCNTPYQVLIALNYVYTQQEFKNPIVDFYIGNQFSQAGQICRRLENVTFIHKAFLYQINKGKMATIFDNFAKLFPYRQLKKMIRTQGENCFQYDIIYASLITLFQMLISCYNPDAKLRFFEDGSGNYSNGIGNYLPERSIALLKLFKRKIPALQPEKIFVNRPELIDDSTIELEKLKSIADVDDTFRSVLFNVFQYHIECSYKGKFVYLQMPSEDQEREFGKKILDIDKKVIDFLSPYQKNSMIRPHPRQMDIIFDNIQVDRSNQMWELLCREEINDDTVLIGFYSTAQFTPKIMYNREPWLVFLFQVLEGRDYSRMQAFVNKIRTIYRRKDKIIVINSLNELPVILKQIQECRLNLILEEDCNEKY